MHDAMHGSGLHTVYIAPSGTQISFKKGLYKLYSTPEYINFDLVQGLGGRCSWRRGGPRGIAEAMRVEDEEEGQEDCGMGEGMAAVDEILERRRVSGGYEARVAWAGTDPETGEAWPHSWVPEAWLSADLRRKRVRLPTRRESMEERRVRRVKEQQLAARRKRVEEARRLGKMAERDRRASDRGAKTHGARNVGPRARVRKGLVVGWQRQ